MPSLRLHAAVSWRWWHRLCSKWNWSRTYSRWPWERQIMFCRWGPSSCPCRLAAAVGMKGVSREGFCFSAITPKLTQEARKNNNVREADKNLVCCASSISPPSTETYITFDVFPFLLPGSFLRQKNPPHMPLSPQPVVYHRAGGQIQMSLTVPISRLLPLRTNTTVSLATISQLLYYMLYNDNMLACYWWPHDVKYQRIWFIRCEQAAFRLLKIKGNFSRSLSLNKFKRGFSERLMALDLSNDCSGLTMVIIQIHWFLSVTIVICKFNSFSVLVIFQLPCRDAWEGAHIVSPVKKCHAD